MNDLSSKTSDKVDFWNLACRAKGMPQGWEWFSLKAIHGGVMVTGAICTTLYKSGPRKGRKNWKKSEPGTERVVFVASEEYDRAEKAWERSTQKCGLCSGSGKMLKWTSRSHGSESMDCTRCGGSGKALQL